MRKFLFIFGIFLATARLQAQELNCQIQIITDQIAGSDKHIYPIMQTAITEFMNTRKWTNDAFRTEERIDCSMLMNLTSKDGDTYTGTLQIQSRRPVFKTSYPSTLLNYNDNDFSFKFTEGQTMDYNDNTYTSNLTSVLAYYAYVILGLDYDSFSMNGGTPYFQKALAIVNSAQGASDKGWKAFESNKNRYWYINNMMDAPFVPIRECMYNYHRKGLDAMVDNKDAGRAVIAEAIESLRKVHDAKPLSFNMQVFFNAKSTEIMNIFSGAYPDEKGKVVNTLKLIDPTNSNNYDKIMASQ